MLQSFALALAAAPFLAQDPALEPADVAAAAKVIGLTFTDAEIELMLPDLRERLAFLDELRDEPLPNDVPPALVFHPRVPGMAPPRMEQLVAPLPALRPTDLGLDDEAFYFQSIPELSAAIRARRISCVEVTEAYLARLERLDRTLHCVVHLCPERALEQARALDAELDAGRWRGDLHGIPWGVKDLMAVPGTPTTWGAKPFALQELQETAAVVERLDAAGAVLIAKLSVGALAWGDVWYGGRTRSPWDPRRGSSGSSAGSASATAAGGVAFALGTETLGSIVSPSVVCATSALRPTFGRVSRHGIMALCWSMDKVGPITRDIADARIVFAAIEGRDPRDMFSRGSDVPSRVEVPFVPRVIGVRAGVRGSSELLDEAATQLEALGHRIVEVEVPDLRLDGMLLGLGVEAAAAFDELTRSGLDDELTRQGRRAWPERLPGGAHRAGRGVRPGPAASDAAHARHGQGVFAHDHRRGRSAAPRRDPPHALWRQDPVDHQPDRTSDGGHALRAEHRATQGRVAGHRLLDWPPRPRRGAHGGGGGVAAGSP